MLHTEAYCHAAKLQLDSFLNLRNNDLNFVFDFRLASSHTLNFVFPVALGRLIRGLPRLLRKFVGVALSLSCLKPDPVLCLVGLLPCSLALRQVYVVRTKETKTARRLDGADVADRVSSTPRLRLERAKDLSFFGFSRSQLACLLACLLAVISNSRIKLPLLQHTLNTSP